MIVDISNSFSYYLINNMLNRRINMWDYKRLYFSLFNSVTDAIRYLPEDGQKAAEVLINAQQFCEEKFIDEETFADQE